MAEGNKGCSWFQRNDEGSGCCEFYQRSRPVLGMMIVQIAFAGMNVASKVALIDGMPSYVLVMYRHAVATVTLAPFAFFLERKTRPKLTRRVVMEIFVSSLLGCTLTQNLFYAGMKFTSPALVCAISLMIPTVTYLMAIPLGMERFEIRSMAGKAKVLGTVVTVGGGIVITFYKGPAFNLWRSILHLELNKATTATASSENILKGVALAMGNCIFFSTWFITQTKIGSNYSALYTSSTLMCLFATIQAAVGALILNGKNTNFSGWKLGWDARLLAAIYSGVLGTGLGFTMMAWCIKRKGPLIVTMFTPMQVILVAIMATLLLDEKIRLASLLGSLLIIMGVYLVIWGKSRENPVAPVQAAESHCSKKTRTNSQESCTEPLQIVVPPTNTESKCTNAAK